VLNALFRRVPQRRKKKTKFLGSFAFINSAVFFAYFFETKK
jgi:hypothetical protein